MWNCDWMFLYMGDGDSEQENRLFEGEITQQMLMIFPQAENGRCRRRRANAAEVAETQEAREGK